MAISLRNPPPCPEDDSLHPNGLMKAIQRAHSAAAALRAQIAELHEHLSPVLATPADDSDAERERSEAGEGLTDATRQLALVIQSLEVARMEIRLLRHLAKV